MTVRATVVAVLLGLLGAVAFVGSASAYDRRPVRVSGLSPDSWGIATTVAEAKLRDRYQAITSDYCVGVIMTGHETLSSFVHGLTRYWDKVACAGYTTGGKEFALIFDAKSRYSWTIYRLRGASSADLYG
jgi:hypothetical protein